MAYFPSNKSLILNPDVISSSIYNHYVQFNGMGDVGDYAKYYNYNCLILLYHELEHVNQTIKAENYPSDSLGILVKEGIELGKRIPDNTTLREKLIYKYDHDKVLTEKNAQSMGLLNTLELNKEIKILDEFNLRTINYRLLKVLLYNYTKNKSAAERYYRLRRKIDDFKNISFTENYDNITKLSWGYANR